MAEDREVLREVWQGRIPVTFNLAPDDVYTMAIPDPYYLMLPRMSYLMISTEKVKKHFSKFVHSDKQDADMWFEFEGAPLRWHLPIGVLYDQVCLTHPERSGLPWTITVHLSNFPSSEILRFENRESIESHFMSCIKEADQIKHGGRVVSSMQKKDHNQLWQGLNNDKFDQFWAINRRLMEVSAETEGFKAIPLRIYKRDQPLPQKLIKSHVATAATSGDGQQQHQQQQQRLTTLYDLLQEMASHIGTKGRVLVHGIEPDLETPLQWLAEHLSYADNFLHICVE